MKFLDYIIDKFFVNPLFKETVNGITIDYNTKQAELQKKIEDLHESRFDLLNMVEKISELTQSLDKKSEIIDKTRAERKIVQEELKEKAFLIDASSAIISTCDINGFLTFINPAFLKYTGFNEQSEVIGRKFSEFWIVDNDIKTIEYIIKYGQWTSEVQMRRKDGSLFDVNVTAATITDAFNMPKLLMSTSIDITERKKATDKLKDSELFLNSLIQSIPIPVFYKDNNGLYQKFNKPFEDQFCMTREEIVGKSVFDINPPEIAKIYKESDDKLLKKVGKQTYQTQFINKFGKVHDVIFHKATIVDSHGNIIGIVGGISDITEIKKIERELIKSKKELELIFDTVTDGIWFWDLKNNKEEFSSKYYKMLGYEPNEFEASYEGWINLIHPDDLENALDIAQKYLKNNNDAYDNEFRMRTKSGKYRWIHARGNITERDKNNKPIHMIGIHEDITDRKKSEIQLKKSELKYRLLAENSIDVIWKLDLSLNHTYVSPSIFELTGFTVEEYISLPLDKRHSREDVNRFLELFQETLKLSIDEQKSKLITIECTNLCKNGNFIPTEIVCRGIFENNELIGVQGITRDITERVKYENELKRQRDLFDNVLDKQTDYVVRYTLDKEIIYANKIYCDLLYDGYSCQGLKIKPQLWNSDKISYEDYFKKVCQPPYESETDFRLLVNNEYKWFHVKSCGIFDEKGNLIEIQSVGRDLTEKFELENKIKHQNQLLQGILETQTDCIARCDLNKKILYANTAYAKTFCGTDSVNECYALIDFTEQIHPDDIDIFEKSMKTLIEEEPYKVSVEYRIIDFDGNVRFFRWLASGILDDKGNVCEIQAVGYDIGGPLNWRSLINE